MTPKYDVPDLISMNRPDLLSLWRDVFDRPAPRMLSQSFLRRFLAFELQSRRYGGLDRQSVKAIEQGVGKPSRSTRPALKPGGRLLREWNGVTHVVDVCEDGFVWNKQRYRSLSAIARDITGAHWSGPRFFGLNGTAAK